MTSERPASPIVRHRSGSCPGYDDVLVGNRQGLEMLKSAIDEALASDAGESNAHIGDICGVQLWTDEDLAQASREPTRTDEAIGCLFFIGWIVVIIAGLLAIAWWLMGVLD